MTIPENIYTIILIAAIVILFAVYIVGLIKYLRAGSARKRAYVPTLTVGFLLCVYLILIAREIEPADFGQLMLTLALVLVTGFYALSAYRQADTSVKMAEEMREQRILSSRPVIVQKAVHEKDIWEGSTKDYFSHFEISNVGNSPAIELESSLMDNEGNRPHSIRQTYLRNDDLPVKFRPNNIENLDEAKTYYLVSEYQNIFYYGVQKPLYQTLLPFKISKSSDEGKIYMIAGELESNEVPQTKRIDAFGSGSKPK